MLDLSLILKLILRISLLVVARLGAVSWVGATRNANLPSPPETDTGMCVGSSRLRGPPAL